MTAYDEIAEVEADDECRDWPVEVLGAKEEIVAFVSSRRPGYPKGEFDGYLKGSFNFCISVRFNDRRPSTIIRFPKPGYTLTARREEKVKSEVQVLEYLKEDTTLSVPRVTSWGLTDESPRNLGPFVIMDRVEDVSLANLLKQPVEPEEDDVIMRGDIEDSKLDYVYEQLAEFMVELSRLRFDAIGAIAKDSGTNKYMATEKPFTYNMNEMAVSISNYPVDTFPTAPFQTTREYSNTNPTKTSPTFTYNVILQAFQKLPGEDTFHATGSDSSFRNITWTITIPSYSSAATCSPRIFSPTQKRSKSMQYWTENSRTQCQLNSPTIHGGGLY